MAPTAMTTPRLPAGERHEQAGRGDEVAAPVLPAPVPAAFRVPAASGSKEHDQRQVQSTTSQAVPRKSSTTAGTSAGTAPIRRRRSGRKEKARAEQDANATTTTR